MVEICAIVFLIWNWYSLKNKSLGGGTNLKDWFKFVSSSLELDVELSILYAPWYHLCGQNTYELAVRKSHSSFIFTTHQEAVTDRGVNRNLTEWYYVYLLSEQKVETNFWFVTTKWNEFEMLPTFCLSDMKLFYPHFPLNLGDMINKLGKKIHEIGRSITYVIIL